jgi:phage terminase large subunit-like protein
VLDHGDLGGQSLPYGDKRLQRHILNAVRHEVPQGVLIRKESRKSKKKIDAAIAAILAYEARADALADGRMQIKRRARLCSY